MNILLQAAQGSGFQAWAVPFYDGCHHCCILFLHDPPTTEETEELQKVALR